MLFRWWFLSFDFKGLLRAFLDVLGESGDSVSLFSSSLAAPLQASRTLSDILLIEPELFPQSAELFDHYHPQMDELKRNINELSLGMFLILGGKHPLQCIMASLIHDLLIRMHCYRKLTNHWIQWITHRNAQGTAQPIVRWSAAHIFINIWNNTYIRDSTYMLTGGLPLIKGLIDFSGYLAQQLS